MKTVSAECPKCIGKKYFPTFAHVANGVCFLCNGAGVIDVANLPPIRETLSEEFHKKARFIMNATDAQWSKMTWKQLNAARDFAHCYVMGHTAREVYGTTIIEAWRANGEPFFQCEQEKQLDAFYANR